jgi:hypothetical protein
MDEKLEQLLRLLDATAPSEIDCDEFLSRVGAYVESLAPGAALPESFEAVVQHLRVCPECKDELDGLLKVYPSAANSDSED